MSHPTDGNATGRGLDLVELPGQVTGRAGDSGDAESGAVPDERVVEFGDGDVEAMAEFFLERAHGLAAVLEGVRVLDGELEGECGERHESEGKAMNKE
ncbi:MAG TPA: hypothetical protein VMD97_07550 [Candidatus Aquilonibacter sp.]|nr:hypothetical protein [Candidatus Aquilonibacter sp.]